MSGALGGIIAAVSSSTLIITVMLVVWPTMGRAESASGQNGGSRSASSAAILRAERFELVAPDGNVRAVLGTEADNTGLTVLDAAGTRRAIVAVRPDGVTTIGILNQTGQVDVSMALGPEEFAIPLIGIGSPRGRGLALASASTGLAGLIIRDDSGRTRATLAVRSEGGPLLEFRDDTGLPVFILAP